MDLSSLLKVKIVGEPCYRDMETLKLIVCEFKKVKYEIRISDKSVSPLTPFSTLTQ